MTLEPSLVLILNLIVSYWSYVYRYKATGTLLFTVFLSVMWIRIRWIRIKGGSGSVRRDTDPDPGHINVHNTSMAKQFCVNKLINVDIFHQVLKYFFKKQFFYPIFFISKQKKYYQNKFSWIRIRIPMENFGYLHPDPYNNPYKSPSLPRSQDV